MESQTTIETAFQRFIDTKVSEGREEATIKSYKSLTKDFLAYCEDNKIKTVDSIDKQAIERYKTHLLNTQENANTRNSYLRNVKCFIYFLMEDEEISTFKIKLFPEAPRLEVSTYSDDELKKLLKKPKSDFIDTRGHAMVAFLSATGVRRATLQHVLVKDVDFISNNIILRKVKRNNQYTTQQIPLPNDLKQILRKYITTFKLDTLQTSGERYLFPSAEGTKLHVDSINKILRKYCNRREVEYRGNHEFRRTYATKVNKIVKDTRKLQRLMMIADERVLNRYVSEDYEAIHEIGTQLNLINNLTPTRQLLHKEAI